jgi:hypothetical protein
LQTLFSTGCRCQSPTRRQFCHLRLAWKFPGFTEVPLPWHGVEKIREVMLDMPLAGGVFTGGLAAYVTGVLSMAAAG